MGSWYDPLEGGERSSFQAASAGDRAGDEVHLSAPLTTYPIPPDCRICSTCQAAEHLSKWIFFSCNSFPWYPNTKGANPNLVDLAARTVIARDQGAVAARSSGQWGVRAARLRREH